MGWTPGLRTGDGDGPFGSGAIEPSLYHSRHSDLRSVCQKPRVFPGIGPNPADSGFTGPWPGPSGRRPGLRRDGRRQEHMVNIRTSAGPRARRAPRNASPLSRTRSAFDSLPFRGMASAPAFRQAPTGPGGCADRGRSSPPTGRGTGPAPPRPWGPPRPRRSPPTSTNGAGGIRDGPQERGRGRRAPPGPRPFPSISSACAAWISGAPSRFAGSSLPSGSAVRSGPPGT